MVTMVKFLIVFIATLIARCDIWLRASEDVWPSGNYSLPKPISGCPHSWKEGWLRQHLDDDAEAMQSEFSPNFHMNATLIQKIFLEREFCTKISASPDTQEIIPWQEGFYCIYKKHGSCPDDMVDGAIIWDDEDDNVGNDKKGYIPDFYSDPFIKNDTALFYCCQNEGKWYNSIDLPTENPFYLLPYGSRNCQRVTGAVSSLEYIVYDTEGFSFLLGNHVFTNGDKDLLKIFYCYYEGCQHKFHNDHGLFASSNYFNGAYPDFQFCSWSITVNEPLLISLKFKTLHVPDCNNNYLDIYDGQSANESAFLLRFCGENATSGATLISKTNRLFILFKSGNNSVSSEEDSSKTLGFYAVYGAFPASTVESRSPSPSLSSSPSTTSNITSDGSRKDIQSSNSGNSVIYLSVILPSVATLIILAVLAAIFYRRYANRPVRKENMQTGPTSKSYATSAGHRVTSKSNLNPIYESNVDSLYEYEPGTIEIRNATENILYEPGNEKSCRVYESPGNEIFEANPLYQGIDGDIDSTYSEPMK